MWLPIIEFFGNIFIKIALGALEKKYPGLAAILQNILTWLEGQKLGGNSSAVEALGSHVDKFTVVPAPGDIKKDSDAKL